MKTLKHFKFEGCSCTVERPGRKPEVHPEMICRYSLDFLGEKIHVVQYPSSRQVKDEENDKRHFFLDFEPNTFTVYAFGKTYAFKGALIHEEERVMSFISDWRNWNSELNDASLWF